FPAAPFHRRLLAWVIDIIILFIFARVGVEVLTSIENTSGENEIWWILFTIFLVGVLAYHPLCEILMNGQSFGKKLMGIRVVNENGGQPGIGQFVIRWLIRTSDVMAIVIIFTANDVASGQSGLDAFMKMGIVTALFITDVILVNSSKKNQRLGDMLAHTLLISSKQDHKIEDTVFLQVSDNYVPSFPQVMQLSDRDMNSLKGILDTARKRNDYNLAEMASEKIKNHLKIQTTLSPFDFLEVLLKDYNYLSAN
ncbi:MAG TPA: RDD family protein, partial [Chitinophagaceae bacterium]|nr:RDD family protein [Chitinophagaceae bacterium]